MKTTTISKNCVIIQFKVHAPNHNWQTHRLSLLGSLQELGAWNIDDALTAEQTAESHIWQVEVGIPPMSRFEWVWVSFSLKDKKVKWERPQKRNRRVDCFSGVLHSIYGDPEEVFLQSAACVELSTYMILDEGTVMVISGSTPTTGNWKISKAVEALEFPKESGYWKAHVAFDAYSELEFKWTVVAERDRNDIRLQEPFPHTVIGRRQWMRIAAPWLTTLAIVVDTLVLDDPLDNVLGRTDMLVKERKRRLDEIRRWHGGKGREVSALTLSRRSSGGNDLKPVSSSGSISLLGYEPPASSAHSSVDLKRLSEDEGSVIEAHILKHERGLSRVVRLTQQLSKNYKKEPFVFSIKGKGQTEMPTDSFNAGANACQTASHQTPAEQLIYLTHLLNLSQTSMLGESDDETLGAASTILSQTNNSESNERQPEVSIVKNLRRHQISKILTKSLAMTFVGKKAEPKNEEDVTPSLLNKSLQQQPINNGSFHHLLSKDKVSAATQSSSTENFEEIEYTVDLTSCFDRILSPNANAKPTYAEAEAGEKTAALLIPVTKHSTALLKSESSVEPHQQGVEHRESNSEAQGVTAFNHGQRRCPCSSVADSAVGVSHIVSSSTALTSDSLCSNNFDCSQSTLEPVKFDGEPNILDSSPPTIVFPASSRFSKAEDIAEDEGYSDTEAEPFNNNCRLDTSLAQRECDTETTRDSNCLLPSETNSLLESASVHAGSLESDDSFLFDSELDLEDLNAFEGDPELLKTLEVGYQKLYGETSDFPGDKAFRTPEGPDQKKDVNRGLYNYARKSLHITPKRASASSGYPPPITPIGPDCEALESDSVDSWIRAPTHLNAIGENGRPLNLHGIEENDFPESDWELTLEDKRIIARAKEKKWVSACNLDQSISDENGASLLTEEDLFLSYVETASCESLERNQSDERIELACLNSDIDCTFLLSKPETVDHREAARKQEKEWGDMQI